MKRDQRYGAQPPQIFFACGGRSILLFPGINIIFRHHGGARALSARYISRTKLVWRFWVKLYRTLQRDAAPTLAPPMREPLWRGRQRAWLPYRTARPRLLPS